MGLSKENLRGGASFDLVTEPFVTLGDERKAVSLAQAQFIGGIASSSPLGAFLMPRAQEARTGASYAIFNVGSVPFLAAAAKNDAPFFELLDPGNLAPNEMFEAHVALDAQGKPKWVGSNSTLFAIAAARDITRSLFVPGGDDGAANTTFQRYDPGKQAWVTLPNLTGGRSNATAAWGRSNASGLSASPESGANGKVLVASGSPATVAAFNGTAWSTVTSPLAGVTVEHTGGHLTGNRWTIADGSTSSFAQRYSLSGDSWAALVSPNSVIGGDNLTRCTAGSLVGQVADTQPQDRAVFTGRAAAPLYPCAILAQVLQIWSAGTSRPGSGDGGMTSFYQRDPHGRGSAAFVGGARSGIGSAIREVFAYRETASGTGYWSELQSLLGGPGLSSAGAAYSRSMDRGYLIGGDALSPAAALTGAYSFGNETWRVEASASTAVRGISNGVAAGATNVL